MFRKFIRKVGAYADWSRPSVLEKFTAWPDARINFLKTIYLLTNCVCDHGSSADALACKRSVSRNHRAVNSVIARLSEMGRGVEEHTDSLLSYIEVLTLHTL